MAASAEEVLISPEGTLELDIQENSNQAKTTMLDEIITNLPQNVKNQSSNIVDKVKKLSIDDLTYSSHGNYSHSNGYVDQMTKHKALTVILKLTERCNLNCAYCYYFNGNDHSFKSKPAVFKKTLLSL